MADNMTVWRDLCRITNETGCHAKDWLVVYGPLLIVLDNAVQGYENELTTKYDNLMKLAISLQTFYLEEIQPFETNPDSNKLK